MRLKGRLLCWVDGDLACPVFVWHVNGPRAVFTPQSAVSPDQFAAEVMLLLASAVDAVTTIAAGDDGQGKREGGGELDCAWTERTALPGLLKTRDKAFVEAVEEQGEAIPSGLAEGGLSSHCCHGQVAKGA